ncbi:hypothetical protein [uncultured Ilyobacter sp.]|uniref:hypothetical protein n=1 Tax=uncultured Ilyobacter sp. TaxID=544433 RepID=UPI0029C01FDD|nr:hypothetical protein [uncultured Ilyobacter sp.]
MNIEKELKKFNLQELLYLISEETREMISKEDFKKDIFYYSRKKIPKKTWVLPWNLLKLSFLAIKQSNDYRSTIPKEKDVYRLATYFNNNDKNLFENPQFKKLKYDDEKLLIILFGLSQEQFGYQLCHKNYEGFIRSIILLNIIPKEINSKLNLNEVLKEEVGFNIDSFNELLYILVGFSFIRTDFNNIKIKNDVTKRLPSVTEENFKRIINYYTINYSEIRNNSLGTHNFSGKPIIKTDKNKLIISNHFMMSNLLSYGLYWVIRNHYRVKGTQEFTDEFGRYFESYAEKLFKHYLPNNMYEKIPERENMEMPDWKIETEKYILLLEQKSTLAPIKVKGMSPDINGLRDYMKKFLKAIKQLDSGEKVYENGKQTIKIIVHFETLYVSELLKEPLLRIPKLNPSKYENLFFASMDELEILIDLLNKNEKLFEKIIEEKLRVEKESNLQDGRSFDKIFEKYDINENNYINTLENNLPFFDKFRERKQ